MEVEVVSRALQVRNRPHGMILRLCDMHALLQLPHHSPQQDGLRPVHNYGWCGVARLPVRRALPAGPVPTVGVSQSPSARRRHIHCSRYPPPAREHQHRSCGRTATEILCPLCTAVPAAALIHLPYASRMYKFSRTGWTSSVAAHSRKGRRWRRRLRPRLQYPFSHLRLLHCPTQSCPPLPTLRRTAHCMTHSRTRCSRCGGTPARLHSSATVRRPLRRMQQHW